MTAQDQIDAFNSVGSFFNQWGANIARGIEGLTTGGLLGLAHATNEVWKEQAEAYLIVKDTAEGDTFGKVGQVIADVKYNDKNTLDAIKEAEFNGWDAVTAAAELLPLDLLAVGSKAYLGRADELTTDDAVATAVDVIGLIPAVGWAAKAAKVPEKAAVKIVTKASINAGEATVDAAKIAAKSEKIGNAISATSKLSTLANIGLTAAYFGGNLKQAFDEADAELAALNAAEIAALNAAKPDTAPQTPAPSTASAPAASGTPAAQQTQRDPTYPQLNPGPGQTPQKTQSTGVLDSLANNAQTLIIAAGLLILILVISAVIDAKKRTA